MKIFETAPELKYGEHNHNYIEYCCKICKLQYIEHRNILSTQNSKSEFHLDFWTKSYKHLKI